MVSSNYLVASHLGAEPAHKVALEWLGLIPFLALDLRLGEGTGGLLALPIIEASMRTLQEMATFDEAVGWYAWGMVPTSGRPYWFHSLNDNATVSASYDHTEALLVDVSATPHALLAPLGVEEGQHTLAEAGEGILLLTQADTDLLTLNCARALLPEGFASVHAAQVGRLPDDEAVVALLNRLLSMAQVVIARLHANGTFSHGLERLRAWEEAPGLLCPMLGPRTPILLVGNPSLQ